MGQYYKPILLEDKTNEDGSETIIGHLESWSYGNGAKLMEHSWIENEFVERVESILAKRASRIVWAGDYADYEPNKEENLYEMTTEDGHLHTEQPTKTFRYIINHTMKEYVDKQRVFPDKDGWQIHPLPLLTCEGNGRGGGDYGGNDKNLVGLWARNTISVSNDIPDGYEELLFTLHE
jgi:hypothetical protein